MTTNWCRWTVILLKFYITACNSSLHNYGKAKTDLHWLAKIFIRRVFRKALWLIRNSHRSLLGSLFSSLDLSGWSWFRPGGKDRYTVAGKDTSGLPAPHLLSRIYHHADSLTARHIWRQVSKIIADRFMPAMFSWRFFFVSFAHIGKRSSTDLIMLSLLVKTLSILARGQSLRFFARLLTEQ